MTLQAVLKETYLREQPSDAARAVEAMSDSDLREHLRGISSAVLVRCMDYLTASRAATVFSILSGKQQRAVLHDASPRLALELLASMDEDARTALMEKLPQATRKDLERLQHYAEDSAGRLLDRPYDTIRDGKRIYRGDRAKFTQTEGRHEAPQFDPVIPNDQPVRRRAPT